eukprot:TRINITY_DN5988_c0_g1_i2.p1 TRINITY_DN5988_c0_g1~~TRINITY_DN5988_c0_g1_i2.p1  ORF type:complete len:617 (-),score=136.53 TRINITY_DN5988_c0_g1_i2:1062-2912(-)
MAPKIVRPPLPVVDESRGITVTEAFRKTNEKYPSCFAMQVKRDGQWVGWTYSKYYSDVLQAAKAMIACGLERQRSIAVIGFNSPEWFIAAYAAIHAAGIVSGIYTTNSPEQCLYVTANSESQIVFVEDLQQLSKFKIIRAQLTHVKAIVIMSEIEDPDGWAITWSKFVGMSKQVSDEELDARIKSIDRHDICSLIYTSGTTGNPKGVMITHSNITWVCYAFIDLHKVGNTDKAVSYLPLSHIAEQVASLFAPMIGGAQVFFATPDALKGSLVNILKEVRPTSFFGVPRVWEKIEAGMKASGANRRGASKALFDWFKRKGLEGSLKILNNEDPGFVFNFLQKHIFSKARAALGLDQCRLFVTGAAPTSKSTIHYFMSLGIPIYELFGMSEGAGPLISNSYGWHKIGSVGPPLGNTFVKVEEDGELCIKGPSVFKGYWKDPESTAHALDSDGWLHTGDIGVIDEEGFVYITDRKKELIITAGGENIAPSVIEGMMHHIQGVGQFVVYGDRQKYLVALIVMDIESIHKLSAQLGSSATSIKEASNDPLYEEHFKKGIDSVNKSLAQVQTIKKFKILDHEFSFEGGDAELTATLKLRRHVVYKKYINIIKEMYGVDFAEK